METQEKLEITPSSKVFATGVYLQAIEVEINGKKQWRWVAVGFEDDTYFDGKTIDIYDYANSFEGLFKDVE
ncbi:MAG: hypothetical protein SFU27_00325 [Thermonemataceae bacterium]|nr:hypothetical protein [Thermonemataceae bacterium]